MTWSSREEVGAAAEIEGRSLVSPLKFTVGVTWPREATSHSPSHPPCTRIYNNLLFPILFLFIFLLFLFFDYFFFFASGGSSFCVLWNGFFGPPLTPCVCVSVCQGFRWVPWLWARPSAQSSEDCPTWTSEVAKLCGLLFSWFVYTHTRSRSHTQRQTEWRRSPPLGSYITSSFFVLFLFFFEFIRALPMCLSLYSKSVKFIFTDLYQCHREKNLTFELFEPKHIQLIIAEDNCAGTETKIWPHFLVVLVRLLTGGQRTHDLIL